MFLELKRRNYNVYVGKLGDKEIDFVAEKGGKRVYIQVCYLLAAEETITREFSPLKQIKDYYPRYVLSMDPLPNGDHDGIKRMRIVDFLLSAEI